MSEQQNEQTQAGGDQSHDRLELVGRHVPLEGSGPFKSLTEAHAAGYDVQNPVTGVYQVGVLADGAFHPFYEEPAANWYSRLEAAKAQAGNQGQSQG